MTALKPFAVALLVSCIGCNGQSPRPVLKPTYGTHRVWIDADSMLWQDDWGFTCGRIERESQGWVYHAHVLNWSSERSALEPDSSFNNFIDAVAFVERWRKS